MDIVRRTFTDDSGLSWLAERVGRTSGIMTGGESLNIPEPADILRFTCSDPEENEREATIAAGTLGDLSPEELVEVLKKARKLRHPTKG